MISHIHSTTIAVADQDAALDFYVNTLGWEKVMDNPIGDGMRWLTVVPPGATTQLVLAHSSWRGADFTPSKDSGITLVAPDIDDTYETLEERGVGSKGDLVLRSRRQRVLLGRPVATVRPAGSMRFPATSNNGAGVPAC